MKLNKQINTILSIVVLLGMLVLYYLNTNKKVVFMAKKWPELKKFIPKNPEKYVGDVNDIVMRSSWEIKFAHYCDINPSIIQWNSEGVKIPYWSREDNKMRTYHLDFVIIVKTYTGIKTMLIEIKPYKQTIKPVKTRGKKESSFLKSFTC